MKPWLVGLLSIIALGGMAAAVSTPDPGLRYSVAGPGPLVLRAAPDPGAARSGSLPAGAKGLILTGRIAEGEDMVFWEVLPPGAGDRPAWAPAPRLATGDPDSAPMILQCSGTEPFWGLKLAGGQARMSQPEGPEMVLQASPRQTAGGDTRVQVQRLSTQGRPAGQVVLIRRAPGCSDGMSDLSYPYEAVVTTPSGEVLSGCCRRAGG